MISLPSSDPWLPCSSARVCVLLAILALTACAPRETWVHRTFMIDRTLSSLHEVSIDTPAGAIPTLTGGRGEPLVLIHGFGGDKDNWTRMARHLKERFTIWAPDLLGFGEAPKDSGADYHIHAQAERVLAWADAAHLRRFHVGGNSMGGYIAGDLAANHPDRVLSLWLIDPAGVRDAKPGLVEQAYRENGSIIMAVDSRTAYRAMLELIFNDAPPWIPGFVLDSLADQAVHDRVLRMKVFRDLADQAQPQLNELLPKVQVPTMLVWGERDQVVDVSGVSVLQKVQPALYAVVMPDTGHAPMLDKPGVVAADYLRFHDRFAARTGSLN